MIIWLSSSILLITVFGLNRCHAYDVPWYRNRPISLVRHRANIQKQSKMIQGSTGTLTGTGRGILIQKFTKSPILLFLKDDKNYDENDERDNDIAVEEENEKDESLKDHENGGGHGWRKEQKKMTKFVPGIYEEQPIIDQEGRSWRSPLELSAKKLKRDGLSFEEDKPWTATLRQHTMMLRSSQSRQFIVDEERWLQRYDALCQFYQRHGHTNVPFSDQSHQLSRQKRNADITNDVSKPVKQYPNGNEDDENEDADLLLFWMITMMNIQILSILWMKILMKMKIQ